MPRHPARAEAPGDCPRYAAPLRRRGRLDPLRPVGLWGRAASPAHGIRAPIRPLCAAQIIGCGSGKVAAYESGGASGTRVSLPFPPPLDPPSHPLTFVCGLTRGGREGERHTAGFFHVIGRPPFGEPDEQPPRLIPLAPSPRGAARWSRSRWHASKRRSRPPSPGSVDEARQLGGSALHAARLGRSAAPYRGHGPTTPRPPRLAASVRLRRIQDLRRGRAGPTPPGTRPAMNAWQILALPRESPVFCVFWRVGSIIRP